MEPFTLRPRLTTEEVSSVLLPERLYLKIGVSLLLFLIGGAGLLFLWRVRSDPVVVQEYVYFAVLGLFAAVSGISAVSLIVFRLLTPLICRGHLRQSEERGNIQITDEGVEYRRDFQPVKVTWSAFRKRRISDKAVLLVTRDGDYIIVSSQELVERRAYVAVCDRLSRIESLDDSKNLI